VQERPAEVGLALCLQPDWLGTFDNCRPAEPNVIIYEPSEDFTVKPGDEILKRFVLDVRRNETYNLSHTLSITANRAGTVTLMGKFRSFDHPEVPDDGASIGPDEEAVVTFK